MKLALLLSGLIGLTASAQVPTRVILKCRNAGQDRTLKIEETSQSYAITMTDFAEKQLIGSSYVFKSPNVTVTPTRFIVQQINGTKEHYSIEFDEYATIHGWAPPGVVPAKEKVFRMLAPDAPKFNTRLLMCAQ
jgi:hypothetical protein